MTTYIAILRGINVGGHRKILMADLKVLLIKNELKNVTTYIQSGNVLFSSTKSEAELSQLIASLIHKNFGFEVPVIVRTKENWIKVFSSNPFISDAVDIKRLHVTFLSAVPNSDLVEKLRLVKFENDQFEIVGDVIYLLTPERYSDSKLTNKLFEQKLKVTATTRNWKTVAKLNELSKL
jgi:uncharacterized protein (DUF1697 family)